MIRVRTLFLTVLPSMVAGGFLFASAFGHAETGRDGALGYWPASSDTATGRVLVAQADPWATPRSRRPPVPPAPPVPAVPPVPPVPPPPPHSRHGRGVTVSIHDGRVEIDGIADLVQNQLDGVAHMLDGIPNVPPDVRERVKERVRAVRGKVAARLGKLHSMDVDKIGPEMERMGDEIEKEMEGLDKDLEKLGQNFGKDFGKNFGKGLARSLDPSRLGLSRDSHDNSDSDDGDDDDDEDKDAVALPPSVDSDPDPGNLPPSIADLRKLTLEPAQRLQLAKLRTESDNQIKAARRALDEMSNRLHDALGAGAANEAEIGRQIDAISAQEAVIRKARILTWVRARSVLRPDQRKMVEASVKNSH